MNPSPKTIELRAVARSNEIRDSKELHEHRLPFVHRNEDT